MTRRSCSSCWSPCPRQYTRSPNICDGRSACYGRRSEDEVTRRMSAILGEYSPAGQGCTRHFSVPPLEYKNSTSYKKYRPNFGLNIQESYGKRPIRIGHKFPLTMTTTTSLPPTCGRDASIGTSDLGPSIGPRAQGGTAAGRYHWYHGECKPPASESEMCEWR